MKQLSTRMLLFVFLIALAGYLLVREGENPRLKALKMLYPQAQERFLNATKLLSNVRKEHVDPTLDPFKTGWIGPEFSPVVTTMGSLISKRASINPEFVYVIIDLLLSNNIKEGDSVLIAASASFPALNIMTVIAAETLKLDVHLMSSIGSSTFGATDPQWLWPDIENLIYTHGVIHTRTEFLTYGGSEDIGIFLDSEGRKLCEDSAIRNGYRLITAESYDEMLQKKKEYFDRIKPAVLINIGGNHTNTGGGAHLLHSGLIQKLPPNCEFEHFGLIGYALENDCGVINLLNVTELATKWRLNVDPDLSCYNFNNF